MKIGIASFSVGKQVHWLWLNPLALDCVNIYRTPHTIVGCNTRTSYPRMFCTSLGFAKNHLSRQIFCRTNAMPISLEESSSIESEDYGGNQENVSENSSEELLSQPLSSDELKSLLADAERSKLINKLSEANQQNRYLKRQLLAKEDALVNFKSELAVIELEIQALMTIAEEISQSSIPEGSRKINGRYIQSHLLSRLEALHGKLKEQIKDVEAAQSKEISLFWCGMAESVQLMGSFDGWSQGEHMSPEYDGSFTKFTATLLLRPGRYEIKFLVDGVWQLSPEYPTIGEGLTKNNLLIVE